MSNVESNLNSNQISNNFELEKKIQKYRKRVDNYKQDNENLMTQLMVLKDEIKTYKLKIDEIKILVKSFIIVSKPKDKKPYDEVLSKINIKLGFNEKENIDTDRASKDVKENKKGLLGLFK